MYTEVNNFSIYQPRFYFPIEAGTNVVDINCDSLGWDWTLYLENDIAQWLWCMGTGVSVQQTFVVEWASNLILEDYINVSDVSFGRVTIDPIDTAIITPTWIFNSQEDLLQFYIFEVAILIIILVFIFFKKIEKWLK